MILWGWMRHFVHFSYEKSGEMAVEMLIEMMGQGETAVREVKLGYSLINI